MSITRVAFACLCVLVLLTACGRKEEPLPGAEAKADTVAQAAEPVMLPQTARPQQREQQATSPTRVKPAPTGRKTVSVDDLPALVDAHKDRLNRIYLEHCSVMDMGGSVEFAVHLTKDGVIERVDSTPAEGARFSEAFLEKAREDVGAWNLPVDRAHLYRFRMTFMK